MPHSHPSSGLNLSRCINVTIRKSIYAKCHKSCFLEITKIVFIQTKLLSVKTLPDVYYACPIMHFDKWGKISCDLEKTSFKITRKLQPQPLMFLPKPCPQIRPEWLNASTRGRAFWLHVGSPHNFCFYLKCHRDQSFSS